MNEIFWPQDFTPGFTDNFVSNEVIVAGLSSTLRNSGGEAQSLEDSVQQGGRNFHGFAG